MRKIVCLAAALLLLFASFPFAGCAAQGEPRDRYVIEAEYADGVLSAAMQCTFTNRADTELTYIDFNLYGNAYRAGAKYAPVSAAYASRAYYDGASEGGTDILSVTPCDRWEVCGEDENVLRVHLREGLFPGDGVTLDIRYRLRLARVEHRTGIARRAVNLGNFYPVLCVYEEGRGFAACVYSSNGDPFYSACADYEVALTLPASYTVAASGEPVSAEESGGKKRCAYRLENARDFALVLGEGFSVLQTEREGVALRYYYYDDADPARTLRLLGECFGFFSARFGKYLYPCYSLVQTGFCYGGMEYPALAFVSDAASGQDALYAAVHETAHQWWYAAVGSDQTREAWMDEGLAEYSTLLFFERAPAWGFTREQIVDGARRALDAYCSVQRQVFGRADTSLSRPLADFPGELAYACLTYDKGLLLFETLREALGERRFFAGLRRYYASFCGKIARPEDLAASFASAGAAGIVRSFADGTAVL